MPRKFYGWWITAAAFFSFGLAVGVPYYAMPFFYDYYERTFGWSRSDITSGFIIGVLITIWVGPMFVHRFSPRRMILFGTACTACSFFGFATMTGNLYVYYLYWVIYVVGYIFSGPIPHQVMISRWFRRKRGTAMGIAYVGVGVFGAISAKYIAQPLTEAFGDFRMGLAGMGVLMFVVWPIALLVMKDRPSDIGQHPDGEESEENARAAQELPLPFREVLGSRAFWLLLIGSACSIGSIGAINQHMKLIFLDEFRKRGFEFPASQALLDNMFSTALFFIMVSSIAGRLAMGYLADKFSKKLVMTATYMIVAFTIPLLLKVAPPETPYFFSILFGFGLGADYMLIPLMAAEQFGVSSLARVMAIILPTDTIGQTGFPWIIGKLRDTIGDYQQPLYLIFGAALLGAVAILLLPKSKLERR
jgi:MFS family permease